MSRITIIGLFLVTLLAAAGSRAQVPADAVWIDVRTPAEYAGGHLSQARSIPFDAIQVGVAGLHLAKDAPIYVYCAAGGRAEKAKQSLEAEGYTNVTNAGGLESARKLAETAGQP
ncbi:MAG: rhodanese-like domain-containing protein [Gammaproteobacteria bacterium]|jgi:phage shock protein E|nr:rhodanese-like domain-containing protein [Gammaproteobacteria bacterium]